MDTHPSNQATVYSIALCLQKALVQNPMHKGDWFTILNMDKAQIDALVNKPASPNAKSNDPAALVSLVYQNLHHALFKEKGQSNIAKPVLFNRLHSIFQLLSPHNKMLFHHSASISEQDFALTASCSASQNEDFEQAFSQWANFIKHQNRDFNFPNQLLSACEEYFSFVPYLSQSNVPQAVSLFDMVRFTTAIASVLIAAGVEAAQLQSSTAFRMVSFDISGIQSFIYTVASKGALKGLRARSFYLELMAENMVDELLTTFGLTRANLLYSGGGHAYLLLPNTDEATIKINNFFIQVNNTLRKLYSTELFIAYGSEACAFSDLLNPDSYSNIHRSLSSQISAMKLRRYNADQLQALNNIPTHSSDRECAICGASDNLETVEQDGISRDLCKSCNGFAKISNALAATNALLALCTHAPDYLPSIPIPSGEHGILYLVAYTTDDAAPPAYTIRTYHKGKATANPSVLSQSLFMGDYAARDEQGDLKTFEALADASTGLKRIGVLRLDVDNLGATFISGFGAHAKANLIYTTVLSKRLTLFFKHHINTILQNPTYRFETQEGPREATLVYSGGDDVFLVGAWDEVLGAAIDIQQKFDQFTNGALTLSAGFAIYDAHYPLSAMAQETARLEAEAKQYQDAAGTKDAISLFGLDVVNGQLCANHTYRWSVLLSDVLGEKLTCVRSLISPSTDNGGTFLHQVLALLQTSADQRINIARLAYLLARHVPTGQQATTQNTTHYNKAAAQMHRWALDKKDREQLVTALMIQLYHTRDTKEE